jgi:uncharacterized membrane protein (TIGR02234 family)
VSTRGPSTAVVLCLVGAVVVLVAAGRTWVSVDVPAGARTDTHTDTHTGTDLVPAVWPLGLVGLAGAVALAAIRRTGRTLVGVLLLVTGGAVVVAVLSVVGAALAEELPGQQSGTTIARLGAWSVVTAVGGVLLCSAGAQCVPGTDRS